MNNTGNYGSDSDMSNYGDEDPSDLDDFGGEDEPPEIILSNAEQQALDK